MSRRLSKLRARAGKLGGASTSRAKARAARLNGAKGGRPKRQPARLVATSFHEYNGRRIASIDH